MFYLSREAVMVGLTVNLTDLETPCWQVSKDTWGIFLTRLSEWENNTLKSWVAPFSGFGPGLYKNRSCVWICFALFFLTAAEDQLLQDPVALISYHVGPNPQLWENKPFLKVVLWVTQSCILSQQQERHQDRCTGNIQKRIWNLI